jgi:hypothetical protein
VKYLVNLQNARCNNKVNSVLMPEKPDLPIQKEGHKTPVLGGGGGRKVCLPLLCGSEEVVTVVCNEFTPSDFYPHPHVLPLPIITITNKHPYSRFFSLVDGPFKNSEAVAQ